MNHAPIHDVSHHSGEASSHRASPAPIHEVGQHHPLSVYFKVWGLLFVLSAMSYAVDYFHVEGLARWVFILTFMILKAGLIVAIFMHMAWERMALIYAILIPPIALTTLVWLMLIESDYTFWTRILFFDGA